MIDNNENTESKGFILVVDDVPHNLQVLCNMLGKERYRIAVAQNGQQALDMVEKALPDLILLDVLMPGLNGFEVCQQLKTSERTKGIPVIFLTAKTGLEDIVNGFEMGAVDYFTKPFNETELLVIVKTHLELKSAREKLTEMQYELREAKDKLDRTARTDSLTGLTNRQGIMEDLQKEKIRFERNHKPFTVILGDIDGLRKINERYGNDCGDEILIRLGEVLIPLVRKQDSVARWGGEEFLFLLPETSLDGGRITAEKIRETIANHSFQINGATIPVTMTFGVGAYDPDRFKNLGDCLKATDQALIIGKQEGRNCVVATRE
ncbi:MAG: diguanylate cyclase [bacterium]|nr:diguanylate cyclase [bacterium]